MSRIAYLNTQYPSLSHTFIEREIRAVRAAGVDVQPFSIRPASAVGRLSDRHRQAADETVNILGSAVRLLCDFVISFFLRPLGTIRGLVAAQRLAPPGLRSRCLHLAYWLEAIRLVCEMRRRSLTHVHVHMANNGAAVALLATRIDPSLTYSLSIHGSAEFFHVDSWRLKEKAEGALFVRCISDFCKAQVMAWTNPVSWDRYHVVHCGIDPDAFPPRPMPAPGPLRLLTVGRLDPIKGYSVLLQALAQLSRSGIDWRLDMVGDGPTRALLERQVHELGIAPGVTFSGAVGQDRIQEHFDRADVMIVSSFMEGVPVVLMEAMAKQLAVVSTQVGGVPELVTDGVTGLLVPPGSVGHLADALARLAASRHILPGLGQSARQTILTSFSIDHVGSEMCRLFRQYVFDVQDPARMRAAAGMGRSEPLPITPAP